MSKSSGNFDSVAFAEINSALEDVRSRISRNGINKLRTEEKLSFLREEVVTLETDLRNKTAELEAMARKGVSLLTRKGNVSSDLVGLLLRLPAEDCHPVLAGEKADQV